MSTHDLLDKLDGIQAVNRANLDVSVYPESVSRLHRGLGGVNNKLVIETSPQIHKRKVKKNMDRRGRFRTQPITFTEIKEVDEDQTDKDQQTNTSTEIRENFSASSETLLVASSHSPFRFSTPPIKLRSKSEMDLKEFSRPLSFPHHHFRKAKPIEEKFCDYSEDDIEDEVGDKLGQLQPSLHHQLAPHAPLVNPLWRSTTPTAEINQTGLPSSTPID